MVFEKISLIPWLLGLKIYDLVLVYISILNRNRHNPNLSHTVADFNIDWIMYGQNSFYHRNLLSNALI